MVKKDTVAAILAIFCIVATLFRIIPVQSQLEMGEYNPWTDLNDDGRIDIFDIVQVAVAFGSSGTPIEKASIEYESEWIDITDKCGQYFNVTHSLNSTDVMVDIQGRTALGGGAHQRNLGLTGYEPGWSRAYGGTSNDFAESVVQTVDGGYVIAGSTRSYGAGNDDFWLVKTDASGNAQWNKTYGGTEIEQDGSVVQTTDGGYAIAGWTESYGDNAWLVKTDVNGNAQWNKTYGGIGSCSARSLVQTVDGGYALAGYSYGGGNMNFWLAKAEAESGLAWTDSTVDTITLYRGATDPYWNFVRVRIWKPKTP